MSKVEMTLGAVVDWIRREFPTSGARVLSVWDDGAAQRATQRHELGRVYKVSIGSNAWGCSLGWHADSASINALAGAGRSINIEFEIGRDGYPCNVTARPAKGSE